MHKKLNIVICWHMHQPWYRQGLNGSYHLPWVYLHAIKDYADMAWHLERNPEMRCVVNFAPVLLEQIDDYAQSIRQLMEEGVPSPEPLLNYLSGITSIPTEPAARQQLIQACRRANKSTMIAPYPKFSALLSKADELVAQSAEAGLSNLSEQHFLDLLTWYHLSWCGASLREQTVVKSMLESDQSFSAQQRSELIALFATTLGSIIPRYRALSERNQVELSVSPYSHPIIPLLNNFENLACSQPEALRPKSTSYPGGKQRARWHIEKAIEVFQQYFKHKPRGIWLSEGAVSDDAIRLIEEEGFSWTASGEGVWRNSCYKNGKDQAFIDNKKLLFKSFQLADHQPRLFFRDDGLSDLIGFEYSKREPHQAAQEFCSHLGAIHGFLGDEVDQHVVSIILDGENAWEYFSDNANAFLNSLYGELSSHPNLQLCTFAECNTRLPAEPLQELYQAARLSLAVLWCRLVCSSQPGWENTAKNRAWDLLTDAKLAYDVFVKSTSDAALLEQVSRQLAMCEASDWFWWFSDSNPSDSVRDFDLLFREQLRVLYQLMSQTPPDILDQPINLTDSTTGAEVENAGTMRRGQ